MRAIKINVIGKTVTEIQMQDGFKSICKQLDAGGYESIRLTPNDYLWVDDEGLLKEKPIGAFKIEGYPQALSGHGVIFGVDAGGNSMDTKLNVDLIRQYVTFVDSEELPEPKIEVIGFNTTEEFQRFLGIK